MLDFLTRPLAGGGRGRRPGRQRPSDGGPYAASFPTADGVINLAASGQAMFEAFCRAAGLETLIDDPRFASKERGRHREALNAAIATATRTRPSAHWIEALNAVGVPCGPVNRIDEVFADPQVVHLGMARGVTHPRLGKIHLVAQPIEMSDADPELRTAAPEAGEHTRAVLRELGYSDEAIDGLVERGIVGE